KAPTTAGTTTRGTSRGCSRSYSSGCAGRSESPRRSGPGRAHSARNTLTTRPLVGSATLHPMGRPMLRATSLLGVLVLTAAAAGEPAKPAYQVPAPKGWGKETIELPPQFAPDMKWKGVEELRFAPGMFKAGADDFFSYALLFWLPED